MTPAQALAIAAALAWFLVSIPASILAGAFIRAGDRRQQAVDEGREGEGGIVSHTSTGAR